MPDSYQGIALAIPKNPQLGTPFRGSALMPRYILSRFLYTLPVIWLVVSTVFLLIHFVPGDPIQQMLGEGAAAGDIQAARHAYGLDVPLGEQYLNYWKGVLHGR